MLKIRTLKHFINDRNGTGPGMEGMIGRKQTGDAPVPWRVRGLVGDVTADLTILQKACPGHSTGIRKQNHTQTATLLTCKQGKAFHRFKVQGK